MTTKGIHPHLLQCKNDVQQDLSIGKKLIDVDLASYKLKSPIWLIDDDWNALAECSISEGLSGAVEARCDYLYQGDEAQVLSQTLIRLFAGEVDPYIYLLAPKQDYIEAMQSGVFTRESLVDEGFIHATPYSQLTRLANKYYKDVVEPHILKIAKAMIKPEVKWEPAKGGLYPHIYGALNSDAIVAIEPIFLNESGNFNIR